MESVHIPHAHFRSSNQLFYLFNIYITGPGGWPRTVGHDLKFESTGGKMMLAPHSARRVETRRAEWARRSWSALLRHSSDSVAAATPSQLRRSSAARSISSVAAASARRDAQNEREWAGLRISVAAATPSQQRLRRSSVAAALRAPWAVDGASGGV